MEIKQAGDFRNILGVLYNNITLYESKDERVRSYFLKSIKNIESDYIFGDVNKLPTLEKHYSFKELKEIMSVTSKENLKKVNSLVGKINEELKLESMDTKNFKYLMNEFCLALDGRGLETKY